MFHVTDFTAPPAPATSDSASPNAQGQPQTHSPAHDVADRIAALSRPRLLVRAARFAAAHFQRSRDLRGILRAQTTPPPLRALVQLLDLEEAVNEARLRGGMQYRSTRHIELLGAIIAESAVLTPQADPARAPAARPQTYPNWSGISDCRRST